MRRVLGGGGGGGGGVAVAEESKVATCHSLGSDGVGGRVIKFASRGTPKLSGSQVKENNDKFKLQEEAHIWEPQRLNEGLAGFPIINKGVNIAHPFLHLAAAEIG